MHFLSEKERRELNALRRDERDKVGIMSCIEYRTNVRVELICWKRERCVVCVKHALLTIISLP